MDGQEGGLALCKRLLARVGAGHTATIHTQDPRLAERYGLEIPANRILINSPAAQGCFGLSTGLMPSAVSLDARLSAKNPRTTRCCLTVSKLICKKSMLSPP